MDRPTSPLTRYRSCQDAFVISQSWLKNLRDTYASTLITHGITLQWIPIQLGHGSIAVTQRHCAKDMATDS